jgi:site-specific DNA recombinase
MRFARGALYTLLRNPIYVGEVRHKGTGYPGQHQPIVERSIWDKTQKLLRSRAARADGEPNRSMSSPLAGKLFDESGRRLTPSHAVKGKRRYRYYISRCLITGSAKRTEAGWRVPAAELERSVATAATMILDDHTAILAGIEQSNSDASHLKSILDAASAWSSRLRSEDEAAGALELLVERVELRPDGIQLSIKLLTGSSEKMIDRGPAQLRLTRLIPLQMRRRGVEMKFVVNGDSAPRTDTVLLKLIARAHCWFDDLMSGRAASMVEIAQREKVGKRYVSRVIRLAFLAPEIVEQIVNGCQPPELTAQSLLNDRTELPLAWEAQHKVLGFPLPA